MNMDLKTITGELQEAYPSLATIVLTEDNIVVFKVFIEYKDENISKDTLIEKFATFGKVQDYSLIERQNGDKIFKVTYFDPLSAARLLHNRVIRLNHSDILIKVCPSWEQPLQLTNNVENNIANTSSTSTSNSPEPAGDNILSLNEYCLAMIFDYLDLKSQLSFSICHDHLENIFINMICPRFKSELFINAKVANRFSNWEKWQLFKTASQYVKSIKIEKYYIANKSETLIFNMIDEFCTFVERVQLIETERCLLKIFNVLNINMLTEIELYRCDILDADLEVLVKCPNLTSLGLAENTDLDGDFLPSFKKLQRLSLYNCWDIKMEKLTKACKNNNLKWLDIRTINVRISRSLVLEHCRNLETLQMSITCDKDLERIMVLENLKSLKLNLLYNAPTLALTTLINKFNKNLETLKLFDYISNILPRSFGSLVSLRTLWISTYDNSLSSEILYLISTFKELEELYLSFNCYVKFNDLLPVVKNCHKLKRVYMYVEGNWDMMKEFINSCSEILENRGHNTPLTIFLMDTNTEELSLYKEMNNNIYNMLVLKIYSDFELDGLLSDDLPVTEYSNDDDSSEYDDSYYDYGYRNSSDDEWW